MLGRRFALPITFALNGSAASKTQVLAHCELTTFSAAPREGIITRIFPGRRLGLREK